MTTAWFHTILLDNATLLKDGIWIARSFSAEKISRSFGAEWKEHGRTNQQKTWDLTATQRLQQFYIDTQTTADTLTGITLLDAGCGNGQLTKAIANTGANVIGIDVHSWLPANFSADNIQFVQGDFDDPPFHKKAFDIIIANGSIHHTKDTFHSFSSMASLVKENGKLYVWVYKIPGGWWQRFLVWWLDLFRFFISRFPAGLQKFCVNILTGFFFLLSRVRKGQNSNRTREEIRINVYDAFTPRYRHYHSPAEVTQWYRHCGFDEPVISHPDNGIGFGMVARKIKDQ